MLAFFLLFHHWNENLVRDLMNEGTEVGFGF
jgi:hypothetical protein